MLKSKRPSIFGYYNPKTIDIYFHSTYIFCTIQCLKNLVWQAASYVSPLICLLPKDVNICILSTVTNMPIIYLFLSCTETNIIEYKCFWTSCFSRCNVISGTDLCTFVRLWVRVPCFQSASPNWCWEVRWTVPCPILYEGYDQEASHDDIQHLAKVFLWKGGHFAFLDHFRFWTIYAFIVHSVSFWQIRIHVCGCTLPVRKQRTFTITS